jgi:hypothetical protein
MPLLEDLGDKLSVGDGARQLECADQQREQAEGLSSGRSRVARGQAGGDLVDQSQDPVGVGVLGGVAAAPDLVEQRRGRATVLHVVAVLD